MLISKRKKIILFLLLIMFVVSVFSFTQTTKAQISSYWLEYKDSSNVHHISDPFNTKPLCETWWTQNEYLLGTKVKDCFLSAIIPKITPEECVFPQVLDPTTKICVNPTTTCVPPKVLDPTTKVCVTPTVNTDTTYTLLAPLPFMGLDGTTPTIDTLYNKDTNPCPFGKYLNILIKLFLGIAGVLAVIMIVWGGIQYMTSELASSKEEGKKSITNAILGLLLALGAWLILNTINPDLLNVCLNNLPQVSITISPEQAVLIKNRGGGGNCAVITNASSPCYPSTIEKSGFGGDTSASEPFKKLSAQASAICQLESGATANSPIGKTPSQILDKCSDNKPFSFGLFQINAAAHMSEIPACNGAFEVPAGTSQGSCMPGQRDPKTGVCVQWSCKTIEPAYTKCQNYLTNPANNIAFAAGKTLYGRNKWAQWSTYASCNNKF